MKQGKKLFGVSHLLKMVHEGVQIVPTLHQLTEKGKHFMCSNSCQDAFEQLEVRLISAPV